MRRVVMAGLAGLLVLLAAAQVEAGRCRLLCGGCTDPCLSSRCGGCVTGADACSLRCEAIDTGPLPALQIVMVPEYMTEKRSICCTEYKEEQRTRPVTVYKSVPVTEERVCIETVYVPTTETKTVEYTVPIPIQEEKTREYKTTVPVWTEQEEQYTVQVPVLVEVPETYMVKVPVVEEVPCTYTVMVPTPEKRVVMRNQVNVVPVPKTRTVTHCVPVVKTMLVDKDYGHWESRVVDAGCSGYAECAPAACAPAACAPAACAPAAKAACRKVWVPNIVKEEVTVVEEQYQTQQIQYLAYEQCVEQVPYECLSVCYRPETRTGTMKVVKYVDQPCTRTRVNVQYKDEVRTRTKKVLTFAEEVRKETYPVIRYQPEKRTKEVSYTVNVPQQQEKKYTVTRYDCVPETKLETYTVRVPVPVVKEVECQFCRMVPKVVSVTVNPCAPCAPCPKCAAATPSVCGCAQ